jgi:hypothetical protein
MMFRAPSTENTSMRNIDASDSVRKPCATVEPYGESRRARSGCVWIHWWSPVTSAN